uniref:Putative secreted peptide n=1 Tax=Anopheles braziliensis TaxID=58242 RepID=A0A2M3ZRQ2_9DIPT
MCSRSCAVRLMVVMVLLMVIAPSGEAVRVIFRLQRSSVDVGASTANILRSPNLVGSSCGIGQVSDTRGICRSTISF